MPEPMDSRIFFRDVLTFNRTPDTLEVFNEMKKDFPECRLTLVPHQISRSCGFALQFPPGELGEHLKFFRSIQFEANMFRMTMGSDDKGVNHVMAVREISIDVDPDQINVP